MHECTLSLHEGCVCVCLCIYACVCVCCCCFHGAAERMIIDDDSSRPFADFVCRRQRDGGRKEVEKPGSSRHSLELRQDTGPGLFLRYSYRHDVWKRVYFSSRAKTAHRLRKKPGTTLQMSKPNYKKKKKSHLHTPLI